MEYQQVTLQLPSGLKATGMCPDKMFLEASELPNGAYVAATSGFPYTYTVIACTGELLGWIDRDKHPIGYVNAERVKSGVYYGIET